MRDGERAFADLAARAPSSAGFYFDESGDLLVRVRDRADQGLALANVRRVMRRSAALGPHGERARLRVVPADFTFHELSEWRDLAFDQVLGTVDGVYSLDLDESRNRVTIGVDASRFESLQRRVMSQMSALGVPAEALHFKATDAPRALSAPYDLTSYSSDPHAGGEKITFGGYECSLGFVADWNGARGFVTASHCSDTMFGLDPSEVYSHAGVAIAAETADPDGYQCGISTCRGSDANFAQTLYGAQMAVGRILRPICANCGGSIVVDQNHPYLDVVEEGDGVYQGEIVEKVGITTGWTRGGVTSTCVDTRVSLSRVVTCQDGADLRANPGDSGSPVFFRLGSADSSEVILLGVVSNKSDAETFFSGLQRIKTDFGGSWSVIAHGPTPPPSGPLTVDITGYSDVSNSSSCHIPYQAVASGGNYPYYTYTWDTDGVINFQSAESVTAAFPGTPENRYISVTVTDGTGASATATYSVHAESMYDICN